MRRAAELCLSQRVLSAREAAEWGLISRVVRDEDLDGRGRDGRSRARRRPDAGPGRDQDLAAPLARCRPRRPARGPRARRWPGPAPPGTRPTASRASWPRPSLDSRDADYDRTRHRHQRPPADPAEHRGDRGPLRPRLLRRAGPGGRAHRRAVGRPGPGRAARRAPARTVRGRRGRAGRAVVVTEELAAHGLPLLIAVISPAICGSILAAHASRRDEGQLAAGSGRRHPADGVRADRAGRRVQQPQRQHHGPPGRPWLGHHRRQVLHLGRGRMRGAAAGGAGRQRRRAASRCSWCRPMRPA